MDEAVYIEESAKLRRQSAHLLSPASLRAIRVVVVALALVAVKVTELTLPVNELSCVEDTALNAFASLQRLLPAQPGARLAGPILAVIAATPVFVYDLLTSSNARLPLAAALIFGLKACCDASLLLVPDSPAGALDAPLALLLLVWPYAAKFPHKLPGAALLVAIAVRLLLVFLLRDSSSFALYTGAAAALFAHLCTLQLPRPLPAWPAPPL